MITAPAPEPDDDRRPCGVVRIGGTGLEWVCVLPVHAKVYTRRTTSGRNKKGDPIYPSGSQHDGRALQADRHLFVRRYPTRPHGAGQ